MNVDKQKLHINENQELIDIVVGTPDNNNELGIWLFPVELIIVETEQADKYNKTKFTLNGKLVITAREPQLKVNRVSGAYNFEMEKI